MNARQVLDRFEAELAADPELVTLVRLVSPYRAMMGRPEGTVQLLDRLAAAYGKARGLTLTLQEAAP